MEGSIVYSQSEFIQVFFKKGTNSQSIAKIGSRTSGVSWEEPFCTLIQERSFNDAAHQFFCRKSLRR